MPRNAPCVLQVLFSHQPDDAAFLPLSPIRFRSDALIPQDSQAAKIMQRFVGMKGVALGPGQTFDHQHPTGLQRVAEALRAARGAAVIPGVQIEENDEVSVIVAEIEAVQPVDDSVQLDANLCYVLLGLRDGNVR
jgi:hypothetical protein